MNRTNIIDSGKSINLSIQDHHLIKKHQIPCLNKLDRKDLYNIQLLANFLKPTLPGIVTTDSTIRVFQYKILLNVIYLNKNLFQFNRISSPECCFCKYEEETTIQCFFIYFQKHKRYGAIK